MQQGSNNIQDRLNELDAMPEGFEFSSNRVWQNIETGFQPKKKQRFPWLYIAAAAALLIAFFTILPTEKKVDPVVVRNKNIDQQAPVVETVTSTVKPVITKEKINDQSGKNVVTAKQDPVKKTIIPPVKIIVAPDPIISTVIEKDAPAVKQNDIAIAPVPATKPITKRPLKVLHLNELHKAETQYAETPVKKKRNNNWLFNHTDDDSEPSNNNDLPTSKKSIFTIPISTN